VTEQLAGDENLIGVQPRHLTRPFTVVKEMQAKATQRYQAKIAELQKEVDETNQKLGELQGKKEANQRFVVSKEQQDEIERFKKKRAKANQDLKKERRNLAQDIESLQNRLKWWNIIGMPIVVAIVGITLAVVRKQKTKAR
jgi:predicted RNase H-like nuclease (RuvC/YqgF family)